MWLSHQERERYAPYDRCASRRRGLGFHRWYKIITVLFALTNKLTIYLRTSLNLTPYIQGAYGRWIHVSTVLKEVEFKSADSTTAKVACSCLAHLKPCVKDAQCTAVLQQSYGSSTILEWMVRTHRFLVFLNITSVIAFTVFIPHQGRLSTVRS